MYCSRTFIVTLFAVLGHCLLAQKQELIPIDTIDDSTEFLKIIDEIKGHEDALYVFDIDNTLIITNENGFGSDWWYAQTKTNPALKLGVDGGCLFGVLTPLFYAMFESTSLFDGQAECIDGLGQGESRTIALTSRGYTPSVATSTELALRANGFGFLTQDSVYLGENVVLLNGVIYTMGQNKGEILISYLKDKSYQSVFYFDDSHFKVEDVQESLTGTDYDIGLYYMNVAPKVPYTAAEMEHMQAQLCNLIETINSSGQTACSCND